jgi:hypothetical protein
VSPRASLPGAEELFRRTSGERSRPEPEERPQEAKSTKLQVAPPEPAPAPSSPRRGPKHDEKITFYCTSDELMALERARLKLRSEHGVAADRGRIVRAALAYVLEDFDARSDDSVLLRRLTQ